MRASERARARVCVYSCVWVCVRVCLCVLAYACGSMAAPNRMDIFNFFMVPKDRAILDASASCECVSDWMALPDEHSATIAPKFPIRWILLSYRDQLTVCRLVNVWVRASEYLMSRSIAIARSHLSPQTKQNSITCKWTYFLRFGSNWLMATENLNWVIGSSRLRNLVWMSWNYLGLLIRFFLRNFGSAKYLESFRGRSSTMVK